MLKDWKTEEMFCIFTENGSSSLCLKERCKIISFCLVVDDRSAQNELSRAVTS